MIFCSYLRERLIRWLTLSDIQTKTIKEGKDGHARTLELLALELKTDTDDIKRKLEFLENIGAIRRISFFPCGAGKCSECAMHSGAAPCKGCMPDGRYKNMGEMWEVVQ